MNSQLIGQPGEVHSPPRTMSEALREWCAKVGGYCSIFAFKGQHEGFISYSTYRKSVEEAERRGGVGKLGKDLGQVPERPVGRETSGFL